MLVISGLMLRLLRFVAAVAGVAYLSTACAPDGRAEPVAGQVFDYSRPYGAETEPKTLIYNLIGRWFPTEEIVRLDNDTMTPEVWCAREPTHIQVFLSGIRIQCDRGPRLETAIARVDRHRSTGGIQLVLRPVDGSDLRTLVFERVVGTTAVIQGSPCFGLRATQYERFPRIETLRRQILGSQRCERIRSKPAPRTP